MPTIRLSKVCANSPVVPLTGIGPGGAEPLLITAGADGVAAIDFLGELGLVSVRHDERPELLIPLASVWYMVGAAEEAGRDAES